MQHNAIEYALLVARLSDEDREKWIRAAEQYIFYAREIAEILMEADE